jgi:hypothetical protein
MRFLKSMNATRSGLRYAAMSILCLGIAPNTSVAQVSMVEDQRPRLEWRGRLQASYQAEFETDTDGGDEFESWRVGVGGDFGGPIDDSILVGFHANYQHADYDFNLDNGALPSAAYGTNELPKEPWGGIDTIDLMPTTTILIGDRFSVVGAVPIRWSGEVGSDRNGFMAGISALAGWSQIEDDTDVFPVIVLDWQVTDSLRLATEGSWVQGGNTGLFWGPNDTVSVSFSIGYERNRFRLDDNGTTPDTNGIGEITAVPIELGMRLRFIEGAYFDLRLGLGVAGRFRVEDDRGNKLYDQNYDPAPRIRLGLTIPIGGSGSGRSGAENDDWSQEPFDSTNSW